MHQSISHNLAYPRQKHKSAFQITHSQIPQSKSSFRFTILVELNFLLPIAPPPRFVMHGNPPAYTGAGIGEAVGVDRDGCNHDRGGVQNGVHACCFEHVSGVRGVVIGMGVLLLLFECEYRWWDGAGWGGWCSL